MGISLTPKQLWVVSFFAWMAVAVIAVVCLCLSVCDETGFSLDVMAEQQVLTPCELSHFFAQSKELSQALLSPLFQLSKQERPLRLPDLRSHFLFFGCNERPDRSLSSSLVQYGLRGSQQVYAIDASKRVYLRFDAQTNRWTFSEEPSALSVRFVIENGRAEAIVELETDEGQKITTPTEFHRISLSISPLPVSVIQSAKHWEIGPFRAEVSLLEKQGAIWYGKDEVIASFGGEEMALEAERERVQLGSGEDTYVLWVREGDCFVFDGQRWQSAQAGPETIGRVLLRARSVDARAITFDLWNEDGSSHMQVPVVRKMMLTEMKVPEVRLVGALSKRQWIAQIQGQRVTIAPDDWIVITNQGCTKLDSPELFDDYLDGKIVGGLLACSGIEKIRGESCLLASFFDASRSRQERVAVSLYRSWGNTEAIAMNAKESDDDDDEEFFFDDDDDDEDDDEEV